MGRLWEWIKENIGKTEDYVPSGKVLKGVVYDTLRDADAIPKNVSERIGQYSDDEIKRVIEEEFPDTPDIPPESLSDALLDIPQNIVMGVITKVLLRMALASPTTDEEITKYENELREKVTEPIRKRIEAHKGRVLSGG